MRSSSGAIRGSGEVSICAKGTEVEWRSLKSPLMVAPVSRLGDRYLVRWIDPGVDVDAWLDFASDGKRRTLHMRKVDPDGDFSSDYEDLAYVRERD